MDAGDTESEVKNEASLFINRLAMSKHKSLKIIKKGKNM